MFLSSLVKIFLVLNPPFFPSWKKLGLVVMSPGFIFGENTIMVGISFLHPSSNFRQVLSADMSWEKMDL